MKTATVALVLAAFAVALCSCGGTPNPSSTPDPKQACLDANQFQRDATALENAIRSASDSDAPQLVDKANALDQEMSNKLSSGEASGSVINDDFQAALNALHPITTDLLKPDLNQAKFDANKLGSAMIKLAQDCSQVLS